MQVFNSSQSIHDVILDHVSLSWTTDEVFSLWASPLGVRNVTIQWSILSESLNCSTHPEGCHGKGPLFGGGSDDGLDISFHHNLLVHHNDRNPLISNGNADIVNNVIYNYGEEATVLQPSQGVVRTNVVGNSYLPGGDSFGNPPIRLIGNALERQPFADGSLAYLANNVHPAFAPLCTEDPQNVVVMHEGGFPLTQTRLNFPTVTTTDAFQAKTDILSSAGATLPVRDAVDTRIVAEVLNGTGSIIDDPSDVGGWPTLSPGNPLPDTDHDGMPDSWELPRGLNPNDATNGLRDSGKGGWWLYKSRGVSQ